MRTRLLCVLLLVCLLLTGCSWMDGNFHSVTAHKEHTQSSGSVDIAASNPAELLSALESLIGNGREKGIIYVGEYDQELVEDGMAEAVRITLTDTPLGSYAVADIRWELGSNGGKPAIATEISYLHGRTEILKIRPMADMEAAEAAILTALTECAPGIVLYIEAYSELDIGQLVEDFASDYPQYIMEVPQVAAGSYPEDGDSRILELKFTYQNSRDDLRQMRTHVTSMFDAAELYVSSDDSDEVKLSQLYSFLMERFDYQVDTSITPSYSLLRHGVGDSKAFAVVYAAMCRQAGLECHMVTGTRNGEPWYWNIVLVGENYYHVDLLRCSELGGFRKMIDDNMTGYVWDYSAYPECLGVVYTPVEDAAVQPSDPPTEEPTEESQPGTETEATESEPTEPESSESENNF